MIYEFIGKLDTERDVYLISDGAGTEPLLLVAGGEKRGKTRRQGDWFIQRHLITVIEGNVANACLVCRVFQMIDRDRIGNLVGLP